MKKIGLVLVLAVALLATSCQVKTSNKGNADKIVDGVEYYQDDLGEVFAIVIIRKQGSWEQSGIGLTHISKSDVTPEIKAQIKNYKE